MEGHRKFEPGDEPIGPEESMPKDDPIEHVEVPDELDGDSGGTQPPKPPPSPTPPEVDPG